MSDSIYAPNGSASQSQGRVSESEAAEQNVPRNPHFERPTLYILNIDVKRTDAEIAGSQDLKACLPVRVTINRDVEAGQSTSSGMIEFKTFEAAERAYATVRSMQLCLTPDGKDPRASSKPRLLKQLPPNTTDVSLYEMFRPFGPLYRAHCIFTSPSGQHTGFRGMALLEYYSEEDAQTAQDEMHCAEVDGKSISVAIDNVTRRPSRGHEFSPAAQPFVPGSGSGFTFNASAPSFAPPAQRGSSGSMHAKASSSGRQQTGPVLPVPGSNLQYSPSAATYIDPCNLFCKNLDPSLSSKDLFDNFKEFGTIVSARVMHDDNQVSREFGFVSFQQADEASRALVAMNNKMVGRKQMIVRLHEPKRMREQKLASKFGTRPSGSESPTTAQGEQSGQASPNGSADGKKADRRLSNSYFKAALATDIGVVDASELSALTRVVRNEVLAGEFSKRLNILPSVKADEVDGLVSELVKLKLNLAVEALNDNAELLGRIVSIREHGSADPSGSPAASTPTPGGLLVPGGSGAGGDNSSIMSSAPASGKERERILKAVSGLLPAGSPVEDVTDMLISLPKKDRALCLFNPDFLRTKVEEAKEILEISEQEDAIPAPAAPLSADASARSDVAVKGAPLASSQTAPIASAGSPSTHTLATLAQLPSDEFIKLATAPSDAASGGLPLPKADPAIWKETDDFIDSLASLNSQDQKQRLGDQLFKKVRAAAGKAHAPKITIKLLDTEDLRSLAHMMNSYPEVLREKVQLQVPAK